MLKQVNWNLNCKLNRMRSHTARQSKQKHPYKATILDFENFVYACIAGLYKLSGSLSSKLQREYLKTYF